MSSNPGDTGQTVGFSFECVSIYIYIYIYITVNSWSTYIQVRDTCSVIGACAKKHDNTEMQTKGVYGELLDKNKPN